MDDFGLLVILVLVFLFFVFPIYVLSALSELRKKVARLQEEMAWMERSRVTEPEPFRESSMTHPVHPVRPAAPTPIAQPTHVTMQAAAPVTPPKPYPAPAPRPVVPPVAPIPAAPVVTTPPAPAPATAMAETPVKPKTTKRPVTPPEEQTVPRWTPEPVMAAPAKEPRDIESILGANWPAKLGIAAIAVAVAMFLQYAFANGWIVPVAQVAIGLCLSVIMLGLGQYLLSKEPYRAYAQVLASGGIIVYFLSIYAAYSFYKPPVIGYGVAFAALVVGAMAASLLAISNKTEPVAVLCILGAFAAPVLIRETGSGPTSAEGLLRLYGYLAVLNIWTIVLVRLRSWYSLAVVAFSATWLLFFLAGPLKGAGWTTETFAGLYLMFSCYMGLKPLYTSANTEEGAEDEILPNAAIAGLGMVVTGCAAFAFASMQILNSVGALGLPDFILTGTLVALILAGMAAALPTITCNDREIRLLFGYLSTISLLLVMGTALSTASPLTHDQVPVAFGFMLFNYLLFQAVALILHRKEEAAGAAVALGAANVVLHVVMAFHVLRSLSYWTIPATALWMPIAGWIALLGAGIAVRQRKEADALPGVWVFAGLLLPLCSLFDLSYRVAHFDVIHGAALFAGEFVLLSATAVALRRSIALPPYRLDLAAAFANAALFFALIARISGMTQQNGITLLAEWAVAMGLYHALIGFVVLRGKGEEALSRLIYLGLGLTFLTIAIPLQLKASSITIAWAVEAAILVWTGQHLRNPYVRRYGLTLLAIAAGKALLIDVFRSPEPFLLLQNPRLFAGASIVMASYFAAWCMARKRDALDEAEQQIPMALCLAASVFTLLFGSLEIWDYVGIAWPKAEQESVRQFALTLFGSLYALLVGAVSIRQNLPQMRMFIIALVGLTALKTLAYDLAITPASTLLIWNTRMLAGLSVVAVSYLLAWMLHMHREDLKAEETFFLPGLLKLASVLTLIFGSVDLWTFVGYRWPEAEQESVRQFALTVFWAVYALIVCFVGMVKRQPQARQAALFLLALAAIKAVAMDLAAVPASAQLIWNTRMLAGLTVIAVSYLAAWLLYRQRDDLTQEEQNTIPGLLLMANGLTLIFGSVDLWAFAGHQWPADGHTSAQQLSLSIFWMVYALIGVSVGIWKRIKPVRLFAMGLLYVSIVKVFLFDLSGLEGIYRIVSFFLLGVILLLVSLLYTRFEAHMQAEEQEDHTHTPPAAPSGPNRPALTT